MELVFLSHYSPEKTCNVEDDVRLIEMVGEDHCQERENARREEQTLQ